MILKYQDFYAQHRAGEELQHTSAGAAGIFAFITGGIREDAYHSIFILPVDEKMLLGSFHLSEKGCAVYLRHAGGHPEGAAHRPALYKA